MDYLNLVRWFFVGIVVGLLLLAFKAEAVQVCPVTRFYTSNGPLKPDVPWILQVEPWNHLTADEMADISQIFSRCFIATGEPCAHVVIKTGPKTYSVICGSYNENKIRIRQRS